MKVLVVEDDLHTRNIIEMVLKRDRMLRYHQLEVICAADGEEGIALFREHRPDLLITDLLMPKMDGFELIKAVRAEKEGGDLPILATSAIVRDKDVLRRLQQQFDVHLQLKPFSPRVLADRIRRRLQELRDDRDPSAAKPPPPPPPPPVAGASPLAARPTTKPGLRTASPPASKPGLPTASPRTSKSKPPALLRVKTVERRRYEGDLTAVPLASLLLDALEQSWTGPLELRQGTQHKVQGNQHKVVYLLAGHPIFVRSNLRGETLGQLLVRSKKLSEQQHKEVLDLSQQHGLRYGEALVRLKLLTEAEVLKELVAQTRFKIQACLLWRTGSWTFLEDPEVGSKVPRCTVDPVALVFQGLRRQPNVEDALSRLLGGKNARAEVTPLPRLEQYRDRFVEAFGPTVVDMVQAACPLLKLVQAPDMQDTAVQLDALLQAGMVALKEGGQVKLGGGAEVGGDGDGGAGVRRAELEASLPEVIEMIALESLAQPAEPVPPDEPPPPDNAVVLRDRGLGAGVTLSSRPSPPVSPEVRMAIQLIESTYLGLHEKNHYEVLGIIAETDETGIKAAYRIKRRQFDLERFRDMDLGETYGHLEEICAALDNAFTVLSDPATSVAYNASVKEERAAVRRSAIRAEALYQKGLDLMAERRFEEAVDALASAIDLDDQVEYRAHEALACFSADGETPEAGAQAMVRIQSLLAADSRHPATHVAAASISEALGSTEEAVSHLREAIKVDPQYGPAFDRLERLLLAESQFTQLEEEYRRTLFLLGHGDRDYSATLWRRLAQLYGDKLGDSHKAYLAAEAALKLNPDDTVLRAWLTMADREDPSRWPKAAAGYRRLFRSHPDDPSALHELYRLHREAERTDAAYVAASAAMLRGVAQPDQLSFMDCLAKPGFRQLERAIDQQGQEKLRHPDADARLEGLLSGLAPLVTQLHPLLLDQLGVSVHDDRSASMPAPFLEMLRYCSSQLGVAIPRVFLRSDLGQGVEPVATVPAALLVGPEAFAAVDERSLCFRLAVAMSLLAPQWAIICGRSKDLLRDYVVAAVSLALPEEHLVDKGSRVPQIIQKLQQDGASLGRCIEAVKAMREATDHLDVDRWIEGARRTAERVGLLLCGDLIVAGRIVAERSGEAQVDLVDFALTEQYAQLREEVGLAIG